jgi:hypothetical protein
VPRRLPRTGLSLRESIWNSRAFNAITIVTLFVGASIATGAATGAFLALIGATLSMHTAEALAVALGVLAVLSAIMQLRGKKSIFIQRDRETPYRWLYGNRYAWAAKNGLALGIGFTSRLGYELWYLVPATALLMRNVLGGALIFATYSFMRAVSSAALLPVFRKVGTAGLLAIIDRQRQTFGLLTAVALGAGGLALSIPAIVWVSS